MRTDSKNNLLTLTNVNNKMYDRHSRRSLVVLPIFNQSTEQLFLACGTVFKSSFTK